ncbi:hypothetical protein CYMTET_27602 [Cymbomonas tetramitiformis]|uniref:Uncharacterized protein n=1 Tax=Cymbomonas tetramitiformis TaxID=36881 RepID=A0AAE0FQ09_9CHLO|nr:hypothetical protein CYMTET_27602 [Cymbomonas tetramitiformis]
MAQEATLTVRERFMRLRLAELAMMQLTTTLAKSQKVCPCTDLRGPCPHTCPKRVRADPRSMTPVKLCIHHKDIHLAKEIITGRHGDVQEPCGGDDVGSSFFSTALLSGESEFLEWLLTDSNVDPKYTSESMLNLPDRFGYTPANKAAVNGYTNVIQLMQAKNADVTSADEDGFTPLMSAVANGHKSCVKLLLKHLHDTLSEEEFLSHVNHENHRKERAICHAARGGHVSLIKTLTKADETLGGVLSNKPSHLYDL